MKKMWLMAVAATVATAVLVSSCAKKEGSEASSAGGGSIRLLNVKVEIDSMLKEYAAAYSARTGTNVEIETVGGGSDPNSVLKGYKASDNMPDIFIFDGPGTYKVWKDDMEVLDSEPWAKETEAAYKDGGHVYGFPYAVEGYGLAYNADVLEKAGVDPASLTTIDAYKEAFEKIDAQKADLGLNAVVSMAASVSAGMTWVTGNHNFGVYLSAGLPSGDTHVIEDVLKGKVDAARLAQFADYVKLLFDYSDKEVLLNGNYDQQMQLFTDGKTAFLHQGNWVDPSIVASGASFKMAFAPHAFTHETVDGIQVGAPSWWAVNKNGNVGEAKKFLNDFALSEEGRTTRITKMSLISPYHSDTIKPATALSASVAEYVAAGKTYPWEQFKLPDGFGMDTLGPIYELLAQGNTDTAGFAAMVTDAVAGIAQ